MRDQAVQDPVVGDLRITITNGSVIGQGSIVVSHGRIASRGASVRGNPAIVDKPKRINIERAMVHAVTPEAMMDAVDAEAPLLVHTPHFGWVNRRMSPKSGRSHALGFSTIGFGSPMWGVFANDNKPRFRNGAPWPSGVINDRGDGLSAGYKAVNGRTRGMRDRFTATEIGTNLSISK